MTSALTRHYPETVLAGLAERLSAPGATAEDIAHTALGKASHLGAEGADPSALAVLAVLDARRRPIRGASLLREAVLQGWGDVDAGLRSLLESAVVAIRPGPGQRQWSLDEVIENRRYLQREVFCPDAVLDWLIPQVATRTPRRRFALDGEDVTPIGPTDNSPLELNLLHLTHMLDGDGLALNKDGAANRRSLLRFVQGLRLPEGDVSEAQDLTVPRVVEPIHHTMALAVSMGLLDVSDGRLTADPTRAESFFEADEDERNKALLKAWRADVLWGSVEALDALEGVGPVDGERRQPLDRSLFSSGGGKLAGARGQLLGDLAQLPLDDWADLDAVVGILLELDRGYLGEALGHGGNPARFVQAALTLALPWLGILALGKCGDKVAMRVTKRGDRMLRGTSRPADPPKPPPFIVQPNLEVTVFLGDAGLSDLHAIYQIGSRTMLSDHVAVFKIEPHQLQKAYGRGLEAEGLVASLREKGRTPLPDNVAFALRDWQRVQRKITLYTDGALLQFPDPDRLDVLAETLAQLDPEGREGVRAGLRELYLPGTGDWALSRVLDMAELHTIDYNSDPPPCFRPVEGLVLEVLPTGLDMVTRAEIEQIATRDDEGRWVLSPKRLRSRWPEDPAGALLDFLGPRIDGGPNPDLVLKVRARIDGVDAEVVEGATVVILSDEAATERLLEIHGVAEWIEMRLGSAALLVAPGRAAAVTALLVKLGLAEED